MVSRYRNALEIIREELVGLEKNIERLEARKRDLEHLRDQMAGTASFFETKIKKSDEPKLAEVLYRRLAEMTAPVHRKDLYAFLKQQGVQVAGVNPINNMTAHMSGDARFKSYGDGMWGLTEWEGNRHQPTTQTERFDDGRVVHRLAR